MLNLLRKSALLLLILSLPMQSQHALAMLLCDPGDQSTAAQQLSHGDVAEHDADHQIPDINLTCDGCGMYHTCLAPAIASNILDVALDMVATLQATGSISFALFIPEQSQRPPRA
ncbi:MAG: hypothetical protein A3G80_07760 [Betaproteobacteria bacterium RIFCSPLOWO2_12_FULL_62_13b]|nr:MAG: hypothetical protein A3G80_07760 [Betaproteobacteria bacterium RIFCSPLOWO2_12_FULL_62_13b]